MKHFARFLLCTVALGALALPSRAVVIAPYPGLDKLIETADIIAIVRVEDAPPMGIDGWTRRSCMVYQTLKGDLKPTDPSNDSHRTEIMLNEFVGLKSNFDGEGLGPKSSHLVFLRHSKEPINGADYSILTYQGADMPLSPSGNETKPAGKTLKARIQTLLARYKTYRDHQIRRENETLNKALAE